MVFIHDVCCYCKLKIKSSRLTSFHDWRRPSRRGKEALSWAIVFSNSASIWGGILLGSSQVLSSLLYPHHFTKYSYWLDRNCFLTIFSIRKGSHSWSPVLLCICAVSAWRGHWNGHAIGWVRCVSIRVRLSNAMYIKMIMSHKRPLNRDDEADCLVSSVCYKSNQRVCPHCDQSLSIKTFRSHKRLFYDQVSN